MKKYVIIYLLLFVNIALADVKIGYIDAQQILTQYEGWRMAQVELEKEQKRLESEYLTLEQQVDSLYQSYQKQEFMMSEERKREKANEIQQKQVELQEFGMKKLGPQNSEIIQIQNQLMQPILKILQDALDIVGKERGFDYILDAQSGAIVFALESNNLTEEVLEQMNKLSTAE